jgi:hypothetical protein
MKRKKGVASKEAKMLETRNVSAMDSLNKKTSSKLPLTPTAFVRR